MKIFNLKSTLSLLMMSAIFFTACKKADVATDVGEGGKKLISFVDVGGKSNFSNSGLILDASLPAQEITLRLQYEAPHVSDEDIIVTLGPINAKVAVYNASLTDPSAIRFDVMPDSTYSLITTRVVIRAGQTLSEPFTFTVFPQKIDAAYSYMLPLAITSITGGPSDIEAAGTGFPLGTGLALYHVIGNPLAGIYESTGYFYHPSSPRAISETKLISAVSPTVLEVDLGDLGPNGYRATLVVDPVTNKVTITAAPGAAGAPYTQFNAALPGSYTTNALGFPGIANYYDPATETFYLRYGYMGGTGWRVTEEVLVKQ